MEKFTNLGEALETLEVLTTILSSERIDPVTPGRVLPVLEKEEYKEVKSIALDIIKSLPKEYKKK